MLKIVTGDDVSIKVQLQKDEVTFVIDSGATVRAGVVKDGVIIIGPAPCLSDAAGADWNTSLVVVSFSSAETAAATDYGKSHLEIEVDDGGKLTWFVFVNVIQGFIT